MMEIGIQRDRSNLIFGFSLKSVFFVHCTLLSTRLETHLITAPPLPSADRSFQGLATAHYGGTEGGNRLSSTQIKYLYRLEKGGSLGFFSQTHISDNRS